MSVAAALYCYIVFRRHLGFTYPLLWTLAGYQRTGPGTSGPAVEPPLGTPLKHTQGVESAGSQ